MTKRTKAGFTLIEILVVIAIIATLAGLVSTLVATSWRKRDLVRCQHNVREITGLLETAGERYPRLGGADLVLYLAKKRLVQGADALDNLFCPGDPHESLEQAGGEAAYEDLDLSRPGEHGHLTSYAGRDLLRAGCAASKGQGRNVVLVADDSDDHHEGKIVVGLTGGAVKVRDKADDYGLETDAPLAIGEGSAAPELVCLRAD